MKWNHEGWPDDFLVYLSDLFDCDIERLPHDVPVHETDLALLLPGVVQQVIENWMLEDHQLCVKYAKAMPNSEPPPIVIQGNELLDGYHRVWAATMVGRSSLPAIRFEEFAAIAEAAGICGEART